MIRGFIKMINRPKTLFPQKALKMVICIPSGITEVEKELVMDSGTQEQKRSMVDS